MPPSAPIPISETRHAELRRALDSLPSDDAQRISRKADLFAVGTGLSGRELFHEALERMLSGKRAAWTADTLGRDLLGILRSIASSKRESLCQRRQRERDFDQEHPPPANSDEQLDLVERVRQLRARLDAQGDVDAVRLLDGMALGFTRKDAAELAGLTPREADAVRKRIARHMGGP